MKRLSVLIICMMFLSISVFAETNPKCKEVEENAIVHIYRPSRLVGFGWNFKLNMNGEKLAMVKNGKHLVLEVEPGQTAFKMKSNFIELNLEPGKHYYFRASLTRNMFLGKPEIVEVTEEQAQKELNKL